MKMTKKILSILLSLMLVLGTVAAGGMSALADGESVANYGTPRGSYICQYRLGDTYGDHWSGSYILIEYLGYTVTLGRVDTYYPRAYDPTDPNSIDSMDCGYILFPSVCDEPYGYDIEVSWVNGGYHTDDEVVFDLSFPDGSNLHVEDPIPGWLGSYHVETTPGESTDYEVFKVAAMDSMCDGWTGGAIEIYQEGRSEPFTRVVNNDGEARTENDILLPSGYSYSFDWVYDRNNSECSVEVTDNNGLTYSAVDPINGLLWPFDVTYKIGDANGLRVFADNVNNRDRAGFDAVLTADIDLGGEPFTPIGTYEHPYEGTFDGCGYTVNRLNVDNNYAGLFGIIGERGTVKNVGVGPQSDEGKTVKTPVTAPKTSYICQYKLGDTYGDHWDGSHILIEYLGYTVTLGRVNPNPDPSTMHPYTPENPDSMGKGYILFPAMCDDPAGYDINIYWVNGGYATDDEVVFDLSLPDGSNLHAEYPTSGLLKTCHVDVNPEAAKDYAVFKVAAKDSLLDGWTGGAVEIYQQGSSEPFTRVINNDGEYSSESDILIPKGYTYDFRWAYDRNNSECSVEVTDNRGFSNYTAGDPASGLLWSFNVPDEIIGYDTVYIDLNGTVKGAYAAGGIAGINRGTVENCAFIGDVQGALYGPAGGIAGENSGVIRNCYHRCSVKTVSGGKAGGIAGKNSGTVQNCHHYGTVENGFGTVAVNTGTVTSCYYNVEFAPGISACDGGNVSDTGALTSAEYISPDNFKNWDFKNVWIIYDGMPVLRGINSPLSARVTVTDISNVHNVVYDRFGVKKITRLFVPGDEFTVRLYQAYADVDAEVLYGAGHYPEEIDFTCSLNLASSGCLELIGFESGLSGEPVINGNNVDYAGKLSGGNVFEVKARYRVTAPGFAYIDSVIAPEYYHGFVPMEFTDINTKDSLMTTDPEMTVTVSPGEPVYGDDITITATLPQDAGENVTFYIDGANTGETVTVENGKAIYTIDGKAINAGSHTALASYSGDSTYSKASVETPFNVSPAPVTLTANSGIKTFDGTEKSVTGFTSSVDNLTFEGVSASGKGTKSGSYDVTFSGVTLNETKDSTGNYIVTKIKSGKLTIGPAFVTLTANSGEETYDGTEKTVTGFESSVPGLTFDGVSAIGSGTNAGAYDVTFTGVTLNETKDSTGNYVVTKVNNGKLTIDPAPVILTADSRDTDVFDGTEKTVTGFTSSVDGLTFDGVSASGSGTDAGAYDVTFTGVTRNETKDSTGNYVVAELINGTLTISPAPVTLTANSGEETYDGSEKSVTGFTSNVDGLTFDGVSASGSGTNAGAYDVTFSGVSLSETKDSTGNYIVTEVKNGKLTISTAEVTVTITGHFNTAHYDGKEHTVSGYDVSISNPLYDKSDFSFSGVAEAKCTDKGTAYMGLNPDQFENNNPNFKVTFNVTDGYQSIVPVNVKVTIKGSSASADYDGSEHIVSGYTAQASNPLYDVANDIAFSGTAEAKRTEPGTESMGLDAGQFSNTNTNFTVTFTVEEDGKLTVNPVVTFANEDGSVLQSGAVALGSTPGYNGETPVKDADDWYTYEFDKWTPEITAATDNATYKATYKATAIEYTAAFIDEDGAVVAEITYTVETQSIEAPAVPGKDGYSAAWEDYTLEIGGVTVKPVYTPENICKLDGEYHGESFWGRVRTFFHNLIWSIFAFFKLNVFFKVSF